MQLPLVAWLPMRGASPALPPHCSAHCGANLAGEAECGALHDAATTCALAVCTQKHARHNAACSHLHYKSGTPLQHVTVCLAVASAVPGALCIERGRERERMLLA